MSAPEFNPMHKDDAVAYFAACSDRLGELAALFTAIRRLADEPANAVTIAYLARLGNDVAADFENVTDCWREELQKGGFRQ